MDFKSESKNLPNNISSIDKTINFRNWIVGYEQIRDMKIGTMLSVSCNYDLNGNKKIEWFIRKNENNRYTHITYTNGQAKETTHNGDIYR